MDQIRTGSLIRKLRLKMGLTQKELAERINVSDKAVSKWECGSGCPDVSLLSVLAEVFGTDIEVLLTGEIEKNEKENGNMKKMKFYVDCLLHLQQLEHLSRYLYQGWITLRSSFSLF